MNESFNESFEILDGKHVNTFSWSGGGGAFNDYNTTKWTKFLSCLHLFDFLQPFPAHRMVKTLHRLPSPLVISTINATKTVLLNISHVHPIHLDFDQVNYTRDLGSLLLFSSLESIDFVGCYATRLNDEN